LLPHQDAARKIIKERLDALQQACASSAGKRASARSPHSPDKLQSMRQDISTHGAGIDSAGTQVLAAAPALSGGPGRSAGLRLRPPES
jgi:hypothetical protein